MLCDVNKIAMRRNLKQQFLEWGLLGCMGVLCVGLSVLQYRWTGDLARAEQGRVHATLARQVPRLGETFNRQIEAATEALRPDGSEIKTSTWRTANETHWKAWKGDPDALPLFRRIATAVPAGGELELFEFTADGEQVATTWPSEWSALRANLMKVYLGQGFPRPMVEPRSSLLEFPVFDESGEERGELEWFIFDLDLDYIRDQMLPRLTRQFLTSGAEDEFEVRLNDDSGKADYSVKVLGLGRGNRDGRWQLSVYRKGGSLDAAIEGARWRNLAASLALIGLIGAAGFLLLQYTQRSRRVAEMQFQFVAGISHEFRTPLTVIRGAGHNLLHGVVSDPKQIERYAKAILRNADDLTEMIENVLSAAGSGKTGGAQERSAVSVLETMDRALDAASAEIEAADCEIELRVEPDLPSFWGDPPALRRIFQNLVSNAARHGGEGKWIGVQAKVDAEGMLEVKVADRGPGIAAEELPHIFEPFWRSERARLDRIRGTGLGLSLTKELLEAHRGSITVESTAGVGTVFTVKLPPADHNNEFSHTAG